MRHDTKYYAIPTFTSFLLFSLHALALSPLSSRIDTSLYASTETPGSKIDGLFPLTSSAQHNLFTDVQGTASTNSQWLASVGLGFRRSINDSAIVGAYLFGDRTRIDHDHYFWLASPGIEYLGRKLDVHMNGYFPLGHKDKVIREGFGEQLGLHTATFRGHSKYDIIAQEIQKVGNGVDLIIGYQPTHTLPFKINAGVYRFDIPKTIKISGVLAGAEYWINRQVNLNAQYSYDNYNRNTAAVGFEVRLGRNSYSPVAPHALYQRLTDPVKRHIAQLGRGSTIPSDVVTQPKPPIQWPDTPNNPNPDQPGGLPDPNDPNDPDQPVLNHIYFFNEMVQDTTPITQIEQCTAESNCGPAQFTQENINNIALLDPYALFYFNGGYYNAVNFRSADTNLITLQPNQQLESRSPDFLSPAESDQMTTFYGGFKLSGYNSLRNISIQQQGNVQTGILIDNTHNNLIQNTDVGDRNYLYQTAITVIDSQGSVIDNSDLFAHTAGLQLQGHSNLAVTYTNVYATRSDENHIQGAVVQDDATLNLLQSQFIITNTSTGNTVGLLLNNQSVVTVENSTISTNTISSNASSGVILKNNSHLRLNGSDIIAASPANTNDPNEVKALTIDTTAGIPVAEIFNNSVLRSRSAKGNAIGIHQIGSDAARIVVNNSSITAFSTHNAAIGIRIPNTDPKVSNQVELDAVRIQVNGTDDSIPIVGNATLVNGTICSKNGILIAC
jgi:hypothetical protein